MLEREDIAKLIGISVSVLLQGILPSMLSSLTLSITVVSTLTALAVVLMAQNEAHALARPNTTTFSCFRRLKRYPCTYAAQFSMLTAIHLRRRLPSIIDVRRGQSHGVRIARPRASEHRVRRIHVRALDSIDAILPSAPVMPSRALCDPFGPVFLVLR